MAKLIIALLIPIFIGFALVRAFIPAGKRLCRHDWLRLALGIGVGFGICSCLCFLWLLTYGRVSSVYIVAEGVLAILSGVIAIWRAKSCCLCEMFHRREPVLSRGANLLLIAFCILFLCACLSFSMESRIHPEGQGDARAIWNLRARFIYRGGDQWKTAFSEKLSWSHPDYPLLLPVLVARTWIYTGAEVVEAPAGIAILFTFATVGLLTAGLYTVATPENALLAGLILLGTASFIKLGAAQYGDVPVSFFFLATMILVLLQDRLPISATVLTGITAALAACTKNEGLLFLVLVIIGIKLCNGPVSAALMGAFGIIALLAIFKVSLAPPNYLFLGDWKAALLRDIFDPSRYFLVIVGFIYRIGAFGGQCVLNPLIPLTAALVLIGGKHKAGTRTVQLILLSMCAGFFSTYLVTPFDLGWHIASSLDRLLLQLWPTALLVCCILELPVTPESSETSAVVGQPGARSEVLT